MIGSSDAYPAAVLASVSCSAAERIRLTVVWWTS